jgi:bifunctional non-homologous end joining protein LigD
VTRVEISNLDKVLWPRARFTKGAMIDYYRRVAPVLLPHLRERPLTLHRFPDGVDGMHWYQTNCRGAPEWLRVEEVRGRRDAVFRMCVVDDLDSLVWVANLGTIELHPFLARAGRPENPDAIVFDLDPGPGADAAGAARLALRIRDLAGSPSFVKTSGSVGLHVYVPADGATFAETKALARDLAARLVAEDPERVTDRQARERRVGKVLVDWLQNDATRSTVAPYSLRGTAFPTASTPVAWEEVERAAAERRPELLTYLAGDVLERIERHGDLWAGLLPGADVGAEL